MLTLSSFQDCCIAVFGLGVSGRAMARALQGSGVDVACWDDDAGVREHVQDVPLVDLYDIDFTAFDYLVLAPGIPHSHPEPHPLAQKAKEAGVAIVSDVELMRRADPKSELVAVTGTNGKSTTTALIGHVLAESYSNGTGGNLGPAVGDLDPAIGRYVLELSSFQLELTSTLKTKAAVLLNITPDHADRYATFGDYVAAKRRIFADPADDQTGIAVIGVDDPPGAQVADELSGAAEWSVIPVAATRRLDNGVSIENDRLIDAVDGQCEIVCDLPPGARLKGLHNAQNAAAAYAVARYAYDMLPDHIAARLQSFNGLPHRQQPVGEDSRVTFINDSKATNAESAAKALASYPRIYWILGGRPKEGGLDGLESYMDRIVAAFVIGEAADDFEQWLQGHGVDAQKCATLEGALAGAHAQALQDQKGGVVLFSPACASFDQYRSFTERGEAFIEAVQAQIHKKDMDKQRL
jgi:UDP-N-acetylmuramoylalanine--D-glutamate ligase